MTGQKNTWWDGSKKGPESEDPGPADSFLRPGLAIPCRVAPQQSPTPFHQATFHDTSSHRHLLKIDKSADRIGGFKIDTSAYRLGQLKTVKSAYRVDAGKHAKSPLGKMKPLV